MTTRIWHRATGKPIGPPLLHAAEVEAVIAIEPSSMGTTLDHVEVRYTGRFAVPAFVVDGGGELTLRNSTVRESGSDGVRIQASNPTLSNVAFVNNFRDAVSMDLASDPSIANVNFVNNRTNGVAVDSGALSADAVWDDASVVYYLNDGVTVPLGRTLTVGAGQIVKPGGFTGGLTVAGRLLVNGTADQPAVFTSRFDDSAVGDTTNNGDRTPFAGDWGAINFTDTSTGTMIRHADIRFGGGAGNEQILVDGGELTLRDSVVRNSRANGLDVRNHAVTITGSTFRDNALGGLILRSSDAVVDGNTFSDNGSIGLRIETSRTTLTGNRFVNNAQAAVSADIASDPTIADVTLINNGSTDCGSTAAHFRETRVRTIPKSFTCSTVSVPMLSRRGRRLRWLRGRW